MGFIVIGKPNNGVPFLFAYPHLLFLQRPHSSLWRIFPKSSRRFTQNLLTGTIVCVYHYIRTDDLVSRGFLEMLEEIGSRLHAIRQHWNIVRSVKNGKPRQTSRKRIQGISCDWQSSNATIMQKITAEGQAWQIDANRDYLPCLFFDLLWDLNMRFSVCSLSENWENCRGGHFACRVSYDFSSVSYRGLNRKWSGGMVCNP